MRESWVLVKRTSYMSKITTINKRFVSFSTNEQVLVLQNSTIKSAFVSLHTWVSDWIKVKFVIAYVITLEVNANFQRNILILVLQLIPVLNMKHKFIHSIKIHLEIIHAINHWHMLCDLHYTYEFDLECLWHEIYWIAL